MLVLLRTQTSCTTAVDIEWSAVGSTWYLDLAALMLGKLSMFKKQRNSAVKPITAMMKMTFIENDVG
jgi:hypothetical protein